MRTAGIICEYNPFHRGHLLQLHKTRETVGEDGAIVCLMSGFFVQRGEPALFSPEIRTRAALENGADLVLELPLPWAIASAEGFAAGGVGVLAAPSMPRGILPRRRFPVSTIWAAWIFCPLAAKAEAWRSFAGLLKY